MLTEIITCIADLLKTNIFIVIALVDFLSKCAILVLIIRYTEHSLFPYLRSLDKHKLWMIATVLLGFLPLTSIFLMPLFDELLYSSNLTFITILVPSSIANTAEVSLSDSSYWLTLVCAVYFTVLFYLLLRFALSFRRILRIKRSSDYNIPEQVAADFLKLADSLGLQKKIKLGLSEEAFSPMTFGVINPVIILPGSFDVNDTLLLENVLIHELIHIRRRDWITHTTAYLIAAFNWFNPFIWRSLKKLRIEAEFTCDDAVLDSGAKREEFALHLVKLARCCAGKNYAELPVQAAINENDLALRVEHILQRHDYGLPSKKALGLLALMYIPLGYSLISVGNVFAIEDETNYATENLSLIHSEAPIYPESAISKGIHGYTRYSFTVDENGEVDQTSIRLVQAEPKSLFNQSSEEALLGFKFKPRKVNGKHRATPGVTYSFNYSIKI